MIKMIFLHKENLYARNKTIGIKQNTQKFMLFTVQIHF